jgi:hypothetical protein
VQEAHVAESESFKRRKVSLNTLGVKELQDSNIPNGSILRHYDSNKNGNHGIIDSNNAKNINANYHRFLGLNLGELHNEFGKASVVTASNNGVCPKFSKYSGVLEWANCVYLWVNLGTSENSNNIYENTFLDGGRSFVWFGGNKMNKGIIRCNHNT